MKETSSPVVVGARREAVYAVLSDLSRLQSVIDSAMDDASLRARAAALGQPELVDSLRSVELTKDSIALTSGMLGRVALSIVRREENAMVRYETMQSPLRAVAEVRLAPSDSGGTLLTVSIDADIPMMLRPLIGSKLRDAVEQIAQMLARIHYDTL